MARERIKTNDGGTAVEDAPEIGEQGNMFPDLDKSKPEEAKLIRLAKTWIKIRDDRKEALDEAKAKEDTAHDAMVELAKSLKIEAFSVGGREVTIEHTDKAKVKTSKVSDEEQDDE